MGTTVGHQPGPQQGHLGAAAARRHCVQVQKATQVGEKLQGLSLGLSNKNASNDIQRCQIGNNQSFVKFCIKTNDFHRVFVLIQDAEKPTFGPTIFVIKILKCYLPLSNFHTYNFTPI